MYDPWQDIQKQAFPKMGVLTSYGEGLKKLTVFENFILHIFYRAMIKILKKKLLILQSI